MCRRGEDPESLRVRLGHVSCTRQKARRRRDLERGAQQMSQHADCLEWCSPEHLQPPMHDNHMHIDDHHHPRISLQSHGC
jgi:hypothetical protein